MSAAFAPRCLACAPRQAAREGVRAFVDPQGRGRQHIAAQLVQLTGTRAGGFVLTRQEPAGKWARRRLP